MARNCIADMPEDIKRKVVDHAHIASTSVNDELFAFAFDEAYDDPFCESVTYGSGKRGKRKRRREEFAW